MSRVRGTLKVVSGGQLWPKGVWSMLQEIPGPQVGQSSRRLVTTV